MSSPEEVRRKAQAELVQLWRSIHDERVLPKVDDAMHVAGVLVDRVFDNRERPHLDFTAGGGVMPLGYNNELVSGSIHELLKFFYQTGPFGEHIHGVQMEYIRWLVPYFRSDARYTFVASENEALLHARKLMGPKRVYSIGWSNPPSHLGLLPIKDDTEIVTEDSYALMVTPVDPDYYEPARPELVQWAIDHAEETGVPLIWNDTVSSPGWTGTLFTAPPEASIVVLGGAIGGGVPLGVLVTSGRWEMSELRGRANRLGGSSLGVTAGLHTLKQVIRHIKSGNLRQVADQLDLDLARLKEMFPNDVRKLSGESLQRAIVVGSAKDASTFVRYCREDGLLLEHAGPVVRVTVPMVCNADDVTEAVGVMTSAILRQREDRADG